MGHDGVAAEKLLTTRTLIKGFAIISQRFNSVGRTIAGDGFNALGFFCRPAAFLASEQRRPFLAGKEPNAIKLSPSHVRPIEKTNASYCAALKRSSRI